LFSSIQHFDALLGDRKAVWPVEVCSTNPSRSLFGVAAWPGVTTENQAGYTETSSDVETFNLHLVFYRCLMWMCLLIEYTRIYWVYDIVVLYTCYVQFILQRCDNCICSAISWWSFQNELFYVECDVKP